MNYLKKSSQKNNNKAIWKKSELTSGPDDDLGLQLLSAPELHYQLKEMEVSWYT